MGVAARVVLDSVSESNIRLTTIEVVFHRFVLAEFNTHRLFSRNSASSRAIPLRKVNGTGTLDRIERDPAIPVKWAAEKPGMQGGDEIEDIERAISIWLAARDDAMRHAEALRDLGVHKSISNRLLEPFMWHTVVVTSDRWHNFFRQRVSRLAQPEIHAAAAAMRAAFRASTPKLLRANEWHMPYIEDDERERYGTDRLRRMSVARCARVSTLNHDGVRDVAKDLDLFERLSTADPMHASPLEHVAMPCVCDAIGLGSRPHRGNFKGWDQYRHEVEDAIGYDSAWTPEMDAWVEEAA